GVWSRQLSTRIKEHKSNINRPVESLSVVSRHRLDGHEFDWENVKILDIEPSFSRRCISEMIHIMRQENNLNVQSDTVNFDKAYL
ncbi:hypothetical protein EAG_14940, partial [Camponotus floridanus]